MNQEKVKEGSIGIYTFAEPSHEANVRSPIMEILNTFVHAWPLTPDLNLGIKHNSLVKHDIVTMPMTKKNLVRVGLLMQDIGAVRVDRETSTMLAITIDFKRNCPGMLVGALGFNFLAAFVFLLPIIAFTYTVGELILIVTSYGILGGLPSACLLKGAVEAAVSKRSLILDNVFSTFYMHSRFIGRKRSEEFVADINDIRSIYIGRQMEEPTCLIVDLSCRTSPLIVAQTGTADRLYLLEALGSRMAAFLYRNKNEAACQAALLVGGD